MAKQSIDIPFLETVDGAGREQRFVILEKQLRDVASAVPRFNQRVLNTLPVLQDLQWTCFTFDRFISIGVPDLDLPSTIMRGNYAPLLGRITKVVPELLHPLLVSERGEPPVVPKWSFNGSALRNPYLLELEGEADALADQLFLQTFHPELAELLKVEARGGPTFKEFFEEQTRDERLKAARIYAGENPFLANKAALAGIDAQTLSLTEQMAELKRVDPTLAEQLEREAGLPGCNPFASRAKNLTRQQIFFKADPKLAAILEAAASYEEKQTAAELKAAEAASEKARAAAVQAKANARR